MFRTAKRSCLSESNLRELDATVRRSFGMMRGDKQEGSDAPQPISVGSLSHGIAATSSAGSASASATLPPQQYRVLNPTPAAT
eukprot:2605574-Prymnesium_polylepis.1